MNKTISSFFAIALAVSALVACQKNDGGGNSGGDGGVQATTPAQNCNIPGTSSDQCNPATYNQLVPNTFINYQWSFSGGFCGCPIGYRPVMNPQWGISCAPLNYFGGLNPTQFAGYSYQQVITSSQNGQWSSIPQITYSPAVSGNGNNCYANASSVCDTRSNSCGTGGVCRPTSGGSYIGLCTYGTGIDTYGSPTAPTSCMVWSNWGGWINRCQTNAPYGSVGGGFGGGFPTANGQIPR